LGYYKIIQYAGSIQGGGAGTLTLPAVQGNVSYFLTTSHDPGFVDLHKGFLGDANDDGTVNFGDFLILSQNFGQGGGWNDGNFAGSATVDFEDFLILSQHFGESIGGGSLVVTADEIAQFQSASAAMFSEHGVPEPSSLSLLAIGGFALLRHRRRPWGA
jgi:hypothetical protein